MEEKQNEARIKALKREAEWIQMSPKARQSKSKARINAYEQMLNEDQKSQRGRTWKSRFPAGPHLGDVVIEAEDLSEGIWRQDPDGKRQFSTCLPEALLASSDPTVLGKRRCSG